MHKKSNLSVIIVFSLFIIGCNNVTDDKLDNNLNGIWRDEQVDVEQINNWDFFIILNNGKYETFNTNDGIRIPGGGKGIYNANNGLFTMIATHYYIGTEYSLFENYNIEKGKWYSKNELKNSIGLSNDYFEIEYGWIFESYIYNYGVNTNNLIFTLVDYPENYPYKLRENMFFKRM